MAHPKIQQRSFGGGEISPEMFGRFDDSKYQTGLARCRNFIVKPQGPVENRPGFGFVRAVKDASRAVRLIPFSYSNTQTMVVELGAGYCRFHTLGATLMNGSVPYEIASPYADDDLFDIHYVQSADVLTLVHPDYAPRELRRLGALNWALTTINFASPIAAPAAPSLVAAGHTAVKYTYHYVVTTLAADGVSESVASASANVGGNLYESGATVTISWLTVAGAARYNVYKRQGGLYGYIGQTDGLSIVDDDIDPDLSKTPPILDDAFTTNGIAAVAITSGGSGYGSALTGGNITAVTVKSMGSQYPEDSTLSVSDPTGSGATFSLVIDGNGRITKVNVLTQGQGYTAPVFSTVGNFFSSAKFAATVTPLATVPPALSVSDSTGSGAELTPIIQNGVLTGINVARAGANYTNPTVTITNPAGGAGAVIGAVTLGGSDYPGAVSYFEQRRCFAGSRQAPQTMWMTKSGTESNMSYSLPTRDDDRIKFRVAAREANAIRHIVPLTQLLLLTGAAEWRVTSLNSDAITPSTISVRPQSYVGASNVQPVIANNSMIYAAARGGHVRELGYNWQANGFVTGDLSLRAPHLFDSKEIVDMAFAKAPYPLVWMINDSGLLIGLTYVPEQQIGAWHWHDTAGEFESCAVVAEGGEDRLYCVVRRTIDGQNRRFIERMASRQFVNQADAFFVDCGLTYSGGAATTISGLSHLEGKTVSILADGAVHPRRVVTGGQITLDQPASVVQIGLPITADVQTLPAAMMLQDGSYGQGHTKNINAAWLRVFRSSGIFVGPDTDRLVEIKQRTTEPYGSPPLLKSEEMPVTLKTSWGDSGQVFVRQSDPLPLTLVNLTLEVAMGG